MKKQTPAEVGAELRSAFPYFADPSKNTKFDLHPKATKSVARNAEKFTGAWTQSDVQDRSTYGASKRFNDFCQIGALLTDESRCLEHLKDLDQRMQKEFLRKVIPEVKRIELQSPTGVSPDKPTVQEREKLKVIEWWTGPKFDKILDTVLSGCEATWGFNKEEAGVPTLSGFAHPDTFANQLLAKKRHFKDPGAQPLHGEYTHRLQWFIICREQETGGSYRLDGDPAKRFSNTCEYGTVFETRRGALELEEAFAYVTVWDLLLDCVRSWSPQNGANFASDTFRSPEYLNLYLTDPLRNTRHTYPMPLLCAYLTARFNKRNWQQVKMGEDFLAKYTEALLKKRKIGPEDFSKLPGGEESIYVGETLGRIVPRSIKD